MERPLILLAQTVKLERTLIGGGECGELGSDTTGRAHRTLDHQL